MSQRVLDFGTIGREIRSLVSRRRELMMFLGSLFAAMGIYLENVLEGKLPGALARLEQRAFFTYSAAVLIPAVLIALRMAKMHAGMVINGTLYARVLHETLRPRMDPARSARLNWGGFSTQLFLLADLIAGLEAALLALAIGLGVTFAVAVGLALSALLFAVFLRMHRDASIFALRLAASAVVEPVAAEELEDHLAGSLEDCNHDMLACIAFVGLILFSVFESLSGLGAIRRTSLDIATQHVEAFGPIVYSVLAVVTSVVGATIYLRLAIAAGKLSLELDPTDRPFQPFKLTDSFLGYCLLAFFLGVSVHLLLFPALHDRPILWYADAAVIAIAVLAYPGVIQLAKTSRDREASRDSK